MIIKWLTAMSLLLCVGTVMLWAHSEHTCDVLRVQSSTFRRVIVYRGSLILTTTSTRGGGSITSASMIDLHWGSRWEPKEWLSVPTNGWGLGTATYPGEYPLHVQVLPLWIVVLAAAILPGIVAGRLWKAGRRVRLHGLGSWLLRVATVVSAVACLAFLILWVRSLCWRGFELDFFKSPLAVIACERPGSLQIKTYSGPESGPAEDQSEWSSHLLRLIPDYSTHRVLPSRESARWQAFSRFSRQGIYGSPPNSPLLFSAPQYIGTELNVPFWFPFLLTLTLPAARICTRAWRGRRSARRAAHTLCRSCGYDLRASYERCPECGISIPAKVTT